MAKDSGGYLSAPGPGHFSNQTTPAASRARAPSAAEAAEAGLGQVSCAIARGAFSAVAVTGGGGGSSGGWRGGGRRGGGGRSR